MSAPPTPSEPRAELVPPGPGRRYLASRRVRLADVDRGGRVRLDAVARYLQDVAADDVRDTGLGDAVVWVVRRTTIVTPRRPRYGERLELATWCSGVGMAWAERRTTITAEEGPPIEAVALWVSLTRADDDGSLRPSPLGPDFLTWYGESAAGRSVRSRLLLGAPPAAERLAATARPWPLRPSDYDFLGHVTNAVSWTAAEEEATRVTEGARLAWGEVEYRLPVDTGAALAVSSWVTGDVVTVWLADEAGSVATAARFGLHLRQPG